MQPFRVKLILKSWYRVRYKRYHGERKKRRRRRRQQWGELGACWVQTPRKAPAQPEGVVPSELLSLRSAVTEDIATCSLHYWKYFNEPNVLPAQNLPIFCLIGMCSLEILKVVAGPAAGEDVWQTAGWLRRGPGNGSEGLSDIYHRKP